MYNKPGKEFDREIFKNPPNEFAVSYSWNWNAPISKEGIIERLDGFVKAGIKCLYILPLPKDFRPEVLRTFLDPEYLTPAFFELVSFAIREAKKRGILAWVYDEGGWPSGGACGVTFRQNPDAVLYKPEAREVCLQCDERFTPEEGFIALFDGKRRLPDDFIPSRNVKFTAYYAVPDKDNLNRIDGTSETAVDTFINNTYEAYKNAIGDLFGEDMPLFFTDEPGLNRDTVAKGLYEKFIAEYGYDIRDYFYVIPNEGAEAVTEEEKRARIDYLTLTGKLFRENTYEKLEAWCEKNGVYFSGHLDLDNRPWGAAAKGYFSHIDTLRTFHVPGIDVIWEQIRYPRGNGAVDDETRGYGFFPRLAPSAARVEGRNITLTETFSIYGDGVTPDEIKFALNYQAVRGINCFNILGLPYGKARCAALMMRPAFCPEKPGFYNLKHINEYYARLSYLLRLGYAEGDTALYQPCSDYAANMAASDAANISFKASGTSLEERNIAFDIIDDGVIRDAIDTGDGLKIGDAIYRHITVPACKYMPEDVKEKIAPYLGEGTPTYTFKSKNLRVLTRKLYNSRLWFVFNEGEETVKETLDIADGKKVYEIDPASGRIYKSSADKELRTGDIAVYLVTSEDIECDSDEMIETAKIGSFKAVCADRFLINYYGFKTERIEGEPTLDEDFSGTVHYEADYEFESAPKSSDTFRITVTDTETSASISADGKYLCDIGMTPAVAYVSGESLAKSGKLTVSVSNTAANEILAKMDVIESHPKAEVGVYNPRMKPFESRRPAIKLGSIRIDKIR